MTVDLLEACRYLGVRGEPDDATLALVTSCAQEVQNAAQPRSTSREVPVRQAAGKLFLGPIETRSADLIKLLAGCERALLFAATLGAGVDRLILRATAASAARAVALDAAASALIESFCDGCQANWPPVTSRKNCGLTPRFSPGVWRPSPLAAGRGFRSSRRAKGHRPDADGRRHARACQIRHRRDGPLPPNPAAVSCGCRCAPLQKDRLQIPKNHQQGSLRFYEHFERIGRRLLFLDGGMGTLLQERGLLPGQKPDEWNLLRPDVLREVHRAYYEAGADIVYTNTFGSNAIKWGNGPCSIAKKRCGSRWKTLKKPLHWHRWAGGPLYVALDVGPTGKLLKPLGDLDFEDCVAAYAELIRAGEQAGADLIAIETMSDLYELKAAVLAAKENSSLPVFATVAFDSKGKLLTGGDAKAVVALLEGLGVEALGMNCGFGRMSPCLFWKNCLPIPPFRSF